MLLLLAVVALLGLRPWATDSVTPDLLGVPPRGGGAIGDAVAVAHAPALAVAPGHALVPSGPSVGTARVSAPAGPEGAPAPILAVAPAQPLRSAPAPASPTPQAPSTGIPGSGGTQPVAPPSEPSTPVVAEAAPPPAATGPSGPSGPIVAGVEAPEEPAEACEGTEYTVTVAFDVEAIASGRTDAEIVLRRVGSDGSGAELRVEGGLEDLSVLLDRFASEGPCVTVEFEPLGEDGGVQPIEPAESPQPTLP